MGVHGLWQLLSSTGKPVPLDSLEGKVLAVDVSVWLHQLSKGMRDGSGNPLPNAHLHGLFTRICKLLYYRIKPVFVFDGGVPTLKKQTLAFRRNKREDAERTSSLMQQKILTNLIRGQALKEACGLDKLPDLPPPPKSSVRGNKDVLYQLPPLPEASKSYLSERCAEEKTDIERWELQQMVEDKYEDVSKIDVESEDFQALPAEVQHEVITDIRLRKKNYNLARIVDLPDDSKDFSNYQMAKLVKHNKLNTRLDEIRKELNERQTRSLTKNYGKRFKDADSIYSQKVISDDSSHYILAKRNLQKKREEEEEKALIKTQLEPVHDKLEVINETDELLLDSDEDSCKDVDVMEESRLIFEEISGKSDELSKNVAKKIENTKKEQISQTKEVNVSEKRSFEDKPRFRAVIEVESDSGSESSEGSVEIVESDSGSESSEGSVEIVESTENEVIVIDDGTVDPELQFAIEQSLKEQRNPAKIKDQNDGMANVAIRKSQDSGPCSKLNENSNMRGVPAVTARRKIGQCKDEQREKVFGKGSTFQSIDLLGKRTQSSKKTDISNSCDENFSSYSKRIDKNDEMIAKIRAKTEDSIIINERKTKSGIIKRTFSSLSIDSTDSEETSSKVQRIEASDTESIIADNNEDSSESEGDFIEVKIDLTKVKDDELFPASMFEQDAEMNIVNKRDDKEVINSEENETDDGTDFSKMISRNKTWKSNLGGDDKTLNAKTTSAEDSENAGTEESTSQHEKVTEIEEEVGSEQMESSAEDEYIKSEDHVTVATKTDLSSPVSSERTETAESSRKRPSSPSITSLVRQFESVTEQHVRGLRENLASENRQLRLELGKQERLAVSITDQMHSEAQELLQLFGIPFIVSPTEAEAQCAQLELVKLTNGTITDDSDIWLFGGKCVFKNFFNQQKHVECFRDVNITSQLGLNRDSLINIALLCGSDYTEGVRGVGPVTAMEILAKFPGSGIEGLAKFKTWWEGAQKAIEVQLKQSKFLAKLRDLDLHPGFPNPQVVEAYLSPTVDDSKEKFSWSLPNLQELRQFAGSKLKWTREKTDEVLLPVLKRLNEKQSQRSISAFFQPEVYMNPAPVKSKRLQKVVNKFINPAGEEEDSDNEEKDVTKKTRSKGQDNVKNEQSVARKKTRSRSKKGQGDNEGQKDISKMVDTDKQPNKRKTRSSKRKDLMTESDGKLEHSDKKKVLVGKSIIEEDSKEAQNTRADTLVSDSKKAQNTRADTLVSDSKKAKVEKSIGGRGHGRGRSQQTADSVEKIVETQILNSDSTSGKDSESDSLTSGTDCENIIWEDEEISDELAVIESGLNIDEILKLKMGCNINEIKHDKEFKQKEKVFENIINVNEILHLESGAYDNIIGEVKKEFDGASDAVNETTTREKDKSPVNTNKKEERQSEELENEGGFIRENDIEMEESSSTKHMIVNEKSLAEEESAFNTHCIIDLDVKSNINTFSVEKNRKSEKQNSKESSATELKKQGTKRTRSSRTNSKRDQSEALKFTLKEGQAGERREANVIDSKACSDTNSANIPAEGEDSSETKPIKTVVMATVKPFRASEMQETLNKPAKQKGNIYANDPINPLISGLPWAEKGKGGRKGQSGRSQGKAKKQKMAPLETFVKKKKPKESKKIFGIVNLSESDSDE